MTSNECVFYHAGSCDHSGTLCLLNCKHVMQKIDGLTYRDHFDLFEKRRIHGIEMKVKWATIIISIAALSVSIINYRGLTENAGKNNSVPAKIISQQSTTRIP